MNENFKKFNSLIKDASYYLETKLQYSPKTIKEYNRHWKHLREFMFPNSFKKYNKQVGEKFLLSNFGTLNKKELQRKEQIYFNSIVILNQFYQTGKIDFPVRETKYPLPFDGQIGEIIKNFIDIIILKNMSRSTLHEHQRNLSDLLKYCKSVRVNTIEKIDLLLLLNYIKQYDCRKKTNMELMLRSLRSFTEYLYKEKYTNVNYSKKIPKHKRINQPKLPSVYTIEEIKTLLDSIDRSTAMGKRNYAIILIATRLGLRASDIANLKLDNLNWHINTITLNQIKTEKHLVLPLFADLGNAIIDYLKYGRPESKERHLFLQGRPPYGRFSSSNVVTHIVQRAFIKSGLRSEFRKFGSHSLRHSLAFKMLEQNTALNIISEVLGHENSESTTYYLRIDLKSMRKCTINVPTISSDFYEQKAGIFYV